MATTPKNVGEAASQVSEFLQGTSARQRLWLCGGAIIIVAVLFLFVRTINQPDMKPLASGMEPRAAQELASRLTAKKIPYELSPDGSSISVAAERLDEGRLEMASQPGGSGGRLGFEIFDKTNWVGSDFDERVNYQRALEGELERTLQTLSGVDGVRVHLALPPDSVFSERDRQAKASVVLKMRGRSASMELQATIARLVAASVDKLEPQQVEVVDAETGKAFAMPSDSIASGSGLTLEESLQHRLIDTLEPVLGAGRVKASVRVEYELTSAEETQESYDPNGSVPLTVHKTEEQVSSVSTGGVPGTASNVVAAGAPRSPAISTTTNTPQTRSENSTYAVARKTRHSIQPAGAIKRIAAALIVDDAEIITQENGKPKVERQKRTPEEMQKIEQLAKATLGIDATRGDVLSIANSTFAETPISAPEPVSIVNRSRHILNEFSSSVRMGLIALMFLCVYFLMLRPIKKQILVTLKTAPRIAAPRSDAKTQISTEPETVIFGEHHQEEAKRLGALSKQLSSKVTAEPALSTRLVQNWIGDSE